MKPRAGMMIVSLLFALTAVAFLIGEKYALAVIWFSLAVVFLAVGRKPAGGSGPPSA